MSFSTRYTSHTNITALLKKEQVSMSFHTRDVNPQSNGSKGNWHLGQGGWERADRRRVAACSVRAIPESQGVTGVNPCVSCMYINITMQIHRITSKMRRHTCCAWNDRDGTIPETFPFQNTSESYSSDDFVRLTTRKQ